MGKLFTLLMLIMFAWFMRMMHESQIVWNLYYDIEAWVWGIKHIM